MPHNSSLVWFFSTFAIGFLCGCSAGPSATADFEAEENTTTDETRPVSLSSIGWGNSLGSQQRAQVEARAQCYGRECTPDDVLLVFQVSGGSDLQLEVGGVTLTADGETLYTPDQRIPGQTDDLGSAVGVVGTAQVTYDQFETLAEAKQCSGEIAGSSFTMDYSDRKPFRALIQRVEGEEREDS